MLLAVRAYSLPGFSNDMGECEVSFYHFCDELGESNFNMCPEKIKPHHKDVCVVSKSQKFDILNSCKEEIESFCSYKDSKDFLFTYTCLVNPKIPCLAAV